MIHIRVPATSANIGPGFDSIGIALNLYAHFYFEPWDTLVIEGSLPEYNNPSNLVYQSYCYGMRHLGAKILPLKITIDSPIPVARGLGSSSACIVAGIMAAFLLSGKNFHKQDLLQLCCDIEGHPDNVAPALLGGLIASMMDEGKPWSLPYTVHPQIQFCALIPPTPVLTSEARAVLPKKVPFQDAVHNLSRTAILLKALEFGDMPLISKALEDKLHQPYRWHLIPHSKKVCQWCYEEGFPTYFISGAGSTLIALTTQKDFAQNMKKRIQQADLNWEVQTLQLDKNGALQVE